MSIKRRRGRRFAQLEEIVRVERTDSQTGNVTILFNELKMRISGLNSVGNTDLGAISDFEDQYVAWISPPQVNINKNDRFIRENSQTLTVLDEETKIDVQRVFLEDQGQSTS